MSQPSCASGCYGLLWVLWLLSFVFEFIYSVWIWGSSWREAAISHLSRFRYPFPTATRKVSFWLYCCLILICCPPRGFKSAMLLSMAQYWGVPITSQNRRGGASLQCTCKPQASLATHRLLFTHRSIVNPELASSPTLIVFSSPHLPTPFHFSVLPSLVFSASVCFCSSQTWKKAHKALITMFSLLQLNHLYRICHLRGKCTTIFNYFEWVITWDEATAFHTMNSIPNVRSRALSKVMLWILFHTV